MNTRVDDGAFIVFRATDEQERMVLLRKRGERPTYQLRF